eukprot:TRINITY_DN3894_c0_g1_i1.p1 TRINITY_DN3894_c0_g1~~TRINITY_DN3894_c0_g1_i1.p1  ORF type:complete len:275 (+),score=64.63 TRINITY_DN3894_c0_g1_i1:1-825(+)
MKAITAEFLALVIVTTLSLSCVVVASESSSSVKLQINQDEDNQTTSSQQCFPGGPRVDCGFAGVTQQACEAKGCCWNPYEHIAWCFHPSPMTTYIVQSVSQEAYGLSFTLAVNGSGPQLFGADVATVGVRVSYETGSRLRIKITDPNNKRWEVPTQFSPDTPLPSSQPSSMDYQFAHAQQGEAFWFTVTRASTGEILFSTQKDGNGNPLPGLVFEDQYLSIATYLPSKPTIYGLGDKVRALQLDYPRRYTMWNFDTPDTESSVMHNRARHSGSL